MRESTNFDEKLQRFAELVERDQIASLHRQNLACEGNLRNARTSIKPGRKYTKVDVGDSGKYMVENATGDIYGIKGYGVIHRGYRFGTLDTIDAYEWGGYRAGRRAEQTTTEGRAVNFPGRTSTACDICGREFEGEDVSEAADMREAHKAIAHKPEPSDDTPKHDPEGYGEREARITASRPRAEFRVGAPEACSHADAYNFTVPVENTTRELPYRKCEDCGHIERVEDAQTRSLFASADTLKSLKVIKDAENLRVKKDSMCVGESEQTAALKFGGVCAAINIDRLARWAGLLPKGSNCRFELSAEGLTLESGTSYLRLRAQSEAGSLLGPLSITPIELQADERTGQIEAPALPDKQAVKEARKQLADNRKAEKIRKGTIKAHKIAGQARRELRDAAARASKAEETMSAVRYAEALNLSVGVRDARRELRRLRAVTGRVEITYGARRRGHGGSRGNANYDILSEPQALALDSFSWATEERRRIYADKLKAYSRKRSEQARAEAAKDLSDTAERMLYTRLEETCGADFAETVKYPHKLRYEGYRAARKIVRAWPALRARLEQTAEFAEDEYLRAFDEYERATGDGAPKVKGQAVAAPLRETAEDVNPAQACKPAAAVKGNTMTNTVTIGRADEVRAYEPAPRPAAYGLPDPIREAVYEAIRAQGEAGPVRCSVSLTRPTPGGVSTVTKFNFTVA